MTIDETTGLPQLPKGYFWRVKRDPVYGGFRVRIMQRRRFWFDEVVGQSGNFYNIDHVSMVASELMIRGEEQQKQLARVAKVLGDYPPKRLGA